jgi:hypothetical protein
LRAFQQAMRGFNLAIARCRVRLAGMKVLLLAALLGSTCFAEETFAVRLVQCQIGRPLGDEVPFEVKPMGHDAGVKLSFLVTGENLVAFKDDSVDIKSFTLGDGRQWARTRSGKANWEQESFSKVGEEGTIGSFTVKFPGDLFGAVEGATLDGSITAITASKSEEGKAELTVGDKTEHKVGPFTVSAGGGGGLFGGGSDGTTITVKGDHKGVIEVVAMDGDTKLDGSGSSWSGDSKSFHFDKAKGKTLAVTVRYWTDLKEVVIPFKMAPVKK